MLQRMNLECHIGQVAQYPGKCLTNIGRPYAGNRTRVDQPSLPALDIGLPDDLRNMAVTAANQVVIPGTGHAPAIVRVVGRKDAPSAKLQFRILPVESEQPAGPCHHFMHCHSIAKIVSMNHMQRHTEFDGWTQRIRTDQVAAMDDGLRTSCLCFGYGRRKRLCTIMTVGNDANFHCYVFTFQGLLVSINAANS